MHKIYIFYAVYRSYSYFIYICVFSDFFSEMFSTLVIHKNGILSQTLSQIYIALLVLLID